MNYKKTHPIDGFNLSEFQLNSEEIICKRSKVSKSKEIALIITGILLSASIITLILIVIGSVGIVKKKYNNKHYFENVYYNSRTNVISICMYWGNIEKISVKEIKDSSFFYRKKRLFYKSTQVGWCEKDEYVNFVARLKDIKFHQKVETVEAQILD